MISTKTSLFCVMGDPVEHSLSPAMHNRAFAKSGFDGAYLACRVRDIASAVIGLRGLGICGASITIPHKTAVIEHLDEIDQTAERIGAVNTIVNHEGTLKGYNTDCNGAVNALVEKTAVRDSDVMIIGAGGAARAVGFGIVAAGGRVTIANRSADRGQGLADALNGRYVSLSEDGPLDCRILINTTSVGMTPDTDALPLDPDRLKKDILVMDIVYNPLETALLKAAREKGCPVIDGVAMFVYQGALQFELWTGKPAPVDVMRQTVLDALKKKPDMAVRR